MKIIAQNKRFARFARRHSAQQGLTLIELLLSLAILAVLTGFLAGGLSMASRAFDADRVSALANETDAAIQALSGLLASALPVGASNGGQAASILFDGHQEAVAFVGLSEGRSLRGGPHSIVIRRTGGDLVVEVAAQRGAIGAEPPVARVVLLQGVRDIRFEYFGKANVAAASAWRTDWIRAERLPDLVSIRLDFEDERRNAPVTMVALRQG